MKPLWALVLAISTAPAEALTCAPATPEQTFDRVAAAPETFFVAHGSFAFDADITPGYGGAEASVPARFTGIGLTARGFVHRVVWPVTLDVLCAGEWCGGMVPERAFLVFLERRADGLHLRLGPCPDRAFEDFDARTLTRLTECYKAGRCAE